MSRNMQGDEVLQHQDRLPKQVCFPLFERSAFHGIQFHRDIILLGHDSMRVECGDERALFYRACSRM